MDPALLTPFTIAKTWIVCTLPAGTRFGRAPEAVQLVVDEQLTPCRMSSLLTPTNRVAFGVMLKPVPVMSRPTECGPAPPYPATAGDPVGWMAVIVGCASAGAAHRRTAGSVRSLTGTRIVVGTSFGRSWDIGKPESCVCAVVHSGQARPEESVNNPSLPPEGGSHKGVKRRFEEEAARPREGPCRVEGPN